MKSVNFENNSQATIVTDEVGDGLCTLEKFTRIINSEIEGKLSLGTMTTISKGKIGSYCNIGSFSFISHSVVGRYTSIGSRVSIGPLNHPFDRPSINEFTYTDFTKIIGDSLEVEYISHFAEKESMPRSVLGSDVWIGDNAVVLSGVEISHGAVIGAGSVVTRNVEPYGIYAGNPARLLRKRFTSEQIKQLLESNWWERDICDLPKRDVYDNIDKFLESI